MASGIIWGTTNNQYIKCKIVWESTPNTSTNSSWVTARLYYWRTNTGYETTGAENYAIGIGSGYDNISRDYSHGIKITSTEQLVFSYSTTVSHDSDGTKQVSISASGGKTSGSFTATYIGDTVTLDAIPRVSTVSLSHSARYLGESLTIYTNRQSGNFTHNIFVDYCDGSDWVFIGGNVTDSMGWNIPYDVAYRITTSNSRNCRIYCRTYSGSTYLGETSAPITFYVPETSEFSPTCFSSITASRYGDIVPESWNMYVQGKSQCKLTINGDATAKYGASIVKYTIWGDSFSSNSKEYITGYLNKVGTNIFTAEVTDSRGFCVSRNVSIVVEPYFSPNISSVSTLRCLSNLTLDDNGTWAKGLCNYTYASCGGHNAITSVVRYKQTGTNTWSANIPFVNNTDVLIGSSVDETDLTEGSLSTDNSYDVEYSVIDSFGKPASKVDFISTGFTTMDFKKGGHGVSVGKVSEHEDEFEIADNWDFRYKDNIVADFIVEQGEKNGWHYTKWNSGQAECYCTTSITVNLENVGGSVYFANNLNSPLRFPFEFVENPVLTGSCNWDYANWVNITVSGTAPKTQCIIMYYQTNANGSGGVRNVYVIAKGKWK